jgi:ketosteroid isomerase-like protein
MKPIDAALAFLEAFAKQDLTTAARYLADDVEFVSPRLHLHGKADMLAAVGEFAQVVTGLDVIAAMADGDQVLVMYDMHTGPFGTMRAADHLIVVEGRITRDLLVFDTASLAP